MAPSDTTFQRALSRLEPGALERAAGGHYETVTLVDHASGMPVASKGYLDEGGEQQALRALFEEVPLRGVVVTLDLGHSGFDTEAALVEQHGADYLLEIKGNCAQTHPTLQGLDWQGARSYSHKWQRAHGRWEWRQLEVVELEAEQVPFRHAQQALRVTHRTRQTRDG